MYSGLITDAGNILVGHASDENNKTGCTVILCPEGAVCAYNASGASPATRETDLLRPGNHVQSVHAIMLSGGSAYGLSAAGGVMSYLEGKGVGLDVKVGVVPIVCAASLFDLIPGGARPDEAMGFRACENAAVSFAQGRVGAGTGATVGKAFGMNHSMGGGFGSASIVVGGITVGVCIAVNALGDVYDYYENKILAGAWDEYGWMNTFETLYNSPAPQTDASVSHTTIGVIAPNAKLTRDQLMRLAQAAHDGMALSIRPVHTLYDGDAMFALSTGDKQCDDMVMLYAAAVEATARAICNSVERGYE